MRKILFFTYIIFIITACGDNVERKLGNGYYLSFGDHFSAFIVDSVNTVMIQAEILDYSFDSTFIIASGRPWDITVDKVFDKMQERDSKLVQYYIINKKEKKIRSNNVNGYAEYSNVHGPFKWDEYLKKRKELGVPKELNLK